MCIQLNHSDKSNIGLHGGNDATAECLHSKGKPDRDEKESRPLRKEDLNFNAPFNFMFMHIQCLVVVKTWTITHLSAALRPKSLDIVMEQ